jgi:hypothetical protein
MIRDRHEHAIIATYRDVLEEIVTREGRDRGELGWWRIFGLSEFDHI